MTVHLSFFAGTTALARVREKGLSPDMVRIVAQKTFDRPPLWAILERRLIDLMNVSAEPLLECRQNRTRCACYAAMEPP